MDHHVTSHSNAFRFHRFTSKQLVLLMTYSICRKSIQTSVNQSQLLSLNILDSLNSTRGSLKQRSTIVGAAISVLLQTTSHQRHPAFDCWPAAAAEVGDSYCLVHRCHWAAPCRSDEHSMSLKRGGLKVTASIVSRLITYMYELHCNRAALQNMPFKQVTPVHIDSWIDISSRIWIVVACIQEA